MKQLRILYQDEQILAVQKPSGMHVHPPEDPRHRIRDEDNCLKVLRRQTDRYLYPVHRLDRPTSGVLLFGLDPESASHLCRQFEERTVKKTYVAIVRGWIPLAPFTITRPLQDHGEPREAMTHVECLSHWSAPWANQRFETSRYSLILAKPQSGRLHQIRRHLAGMGHPLIGDTQRGDGEHNRLFRIHWESSRLWLHALSLEFEHPSHPAPVKIHSPFPSQWHRAFDSFGLCPLGHWVPPTRGFRT